MRLFTCNQFWHTTLGGAVGYFAGIAFANLAFNHPQGSVLITLKMLTAAFGGIAGVRLGLGIGNALDKIGALEAAVALMQPNREGIPLDVEAVGEHRLVP